ncbi:MAG: trigger factor [Bacillota bacterium]
MKAKVEKIENNRAQLTLTIEAEQVDSALDRAYRKIVKEVNIPGFRKGKAPRKIVENHLGTEPIFKEALDFILPEAYTKAVEETKIRPINQPEISIEQFEEGKDLILTINVDVRPEVKLGEYKGLEIKKPEVKVSQEAVEEHLKTLQSRYAKLVSVPDEPIKEGDIALIDYKGYIDGQTFAGGIEDNYALEIGSGTFIEGFEEQLIGAKAGDEVTVNVTFPEKYRESNLAGKPAEFKVTVKEVKRKELAPLDDEFAKDVSEFDTLEELKADIEKRLKEKMEKQARQDMREEVIKKVVDASSVDVPQILVDRRVDAHMSRLSERLQAQGFSLEQYCEAADTTEEEIREKYQEQAYQSVKTDLVLEEIAETEKIEVKEEEIIEEIQELAKEYNENVDALQKNLQSRESIEALSYGIMIDKTVKFLMDNAREVEEEAGAEE